MAKTDTQTLPDEDFLEISDEIAEAISGFGPVLALESTIISHGMPYPRNYETALAVQKAVRDSGAIPATIAILDGKLKVGLSDEEIETLARLGPTAVKCSRRDIPFLLSNRSSGATTVAATMIIAAMAGIRVFATGGIGGVHRGAQNSMDISADLQELARTSVAVVCAGPKAILDIGLTLEYLETHGVPVIGYGVRELPAFWSRKSGFKVDYQIDTAVEIAAALKIKWSLGLAGGAVIANPIPEDAEIEAQIIEGWINKASRQANQAGIKGKDLTPYLLHQIEELSDGQSLESNIALILNNTRLGAEIAIALID